MKDLQPFSLKIHLLLVYDIIHIYHIPTSNIFMTPQASLLALLINIRIDTFLFLFYGLSVLECNLGGHDEPSPSGYGFRAMYMMLLPSSRKR